LFRGSLAIKRGALESDLETPEDKALTTILGASVRKLLLELSATAKAKEIVTRAAGALRSFASVFKLKVGDVGIEVKKPEGLADSGDLDEDIADLLVTVAEAAKAQKTAIILAIDEMQPACHNFSARLAMRSRTQSVFFSSRKLALFRPRKPRKPSRTRLGQGVHKFVQRPSS
jgi:hypothetical protein